MINLAAFKVFFLFLPLLFYAPFFFTQSIPSYLRIFYFLIVSLYLFFQKKFFSKSDLSFLIIFFIYIILIILSVPNGFAGWVTAGNYFLTIFFSIGLYRFFSINGFYIIPVFRLYIIFTYLTVYFSLLSLVFIYCCGEFDLLGYKSDIFVHLVTPFGILFERPFGSFIFLRSFFYYNEPIFASIFYSANIFFLSNFLNSNKTHFILINLIGGILTISYTFVFLLFALFFFRFLKTYLGIVKISIFLFLVVYFFVSNDILGYSSYIDRFERYNIFFIRLFESSFAEILFGHGVDADLNYYKALNSGILISIFESGLFGFVLLLFIFYLLTRDFMLFIFMFFCGLVVSPLQYPFFWFFCIMVSFVNRYYLPRNH